ncbi:MAG: hypothetical protein A3J27_07575 [Candidatus Tectomicrobia bacterium RIFCSPLOWO2_12_FULL_69_37]|nr:MAG: hypothetical protein A3J27_07575 [Candidatus Tectomicrobia bacterium RIFCSPLOWO2_12_FULL_69_37]
MGLWKGLLIAGAAALAWNAGPEARAQERLPIFDAHVHYSRAAWAEYPPKRVLEILAAAGVTGALVSSTPDDGTLMLHRAAPGRIVPILRPYHEPGDMSGWARSGALLAYVDARVKRGIYKGIGEFHLFSAEDARTATLRTLARIALERDIVLHVHSGAAPILAILAHEPKVRILWAHAGMSEPPGAVREVMDKHPGLLTELSFRAGDIAPGGKIDPEWRALLLRHPDRFVVGTDTYTTDRWASYGELVGQHRAWLGQLPREAAEKIAYRNAVRLFGGGRAEPPK